MVDIEGDDLCLDFRDPAVTDTNSLRMLYKIWRCNELKRTAEKARGRRFDVVVRFRADVVPTIDDLDRLVATMRDNEICIPGASPGHVNDTLAISSSAAADTLATLFGTAMQSPERPWEMIHFALANHIVETGLAARNIAFLPIRTSPARQQENRRLLLEAIETGACDADFFDDPHAWPVTALLLRAGIALDQPDGAAAALDIVRTLDFEPLGLDLLRCAGNLLECCFVANGDLGSLCTARIVAVLIEVLLDPARQDEYLHHRMPVDRLTDALLDVSDDQPFEALLHARVFEPAELDPALAALLHEMLRRAGRERVGSILDDVGVVLAGSFEVQSVRFHKALLQRRDVPAATAIAHKIIERFPGDWRGHDFLGHAREHDRDHRGARDSARTALDLDSASPGLMTRLGMLDLRVGELDEAYELFQSARAVWTDDRPWGGLVETEIARGRHGEARALIEEGLARFPDSHWLRQLAETGPHSTPDPLQAEP